MNKYKDKKYPLMHKNFPGAQLKVVPVRIVDIIDEYFVIEYQSKKTSFVLQYDFIKFHKSCIMEDCKSITLNDDGFKNEDIPF